jgi:hypothetical protein
MGGGKCCGPALRAVTLKWSALRPLMGIVSSVHRITGSGRRAENSVATEAEIAWAAGLFEGEGCFRMTNSRGKSRCATLSLQMTDRDTVERFRNIVESGAVRTERRPGRKTIFVTDVAKRSDVERIIRAFLPWLGVRRKAKALELLAHIEALDMAAAQRARFCGKGLHPWVPENIYVSPRGIQACRPCKVTANREWSRMKRATDPEFAQKGRDSSREYARRKRAGAKLVS